MNPRGMLPSPNPKTGECPSVKRACVPGGITRESSDAPSADVPVTSVDNACWNVRIRWMTCSGYSRTPASTGIGSNARIHRC